MITNRKGKKEMKKQMEKRNRKTKRCSGGLCAVLLCAAILTACGSSSPSGQENPSSSQITRESNTSSQAEQENGEASSQSETEKNAPAEENSHQADGNKSESPAASENTSSDSTGQNDGQAKDQSVNEGHDVIELSGSIETVGDGSFSVNQIFTEKTDSGYDLAYSSVEDKNILNIAYNAQTIFTICTTTDGGITSTNSPGTSADLKAELTTLIKGYWEGDTFQAQEIIIYHFG